MRRRCRQWFGLLAAVALVAAPVVGGESLEPKTWTEGTTAWRAAAGWQLPGPLMAILDNRIRAEAVAEDTAAWEGLQAAVQTYLGTLNAVPQSLPPVGSQSWAAGAVAVTLTYVWDPAYWGQLPAGAIGPSGLGITLSVTGRVPRPEGAIELSEEEAEDWTVTPPGWSGSGPAEVVLQVRWPVGGEWRGAERTDGGELHLQSVAGGMDLRVPLAAGAATAVRIRAAAPPLVMIVGVEVNHAVDWEVRGADGSRWWGKPQRVGLAQTAGQATLRVWGLAGVPHDVATVAIPGVVPVETTRTVLLAADGPDGRPSVVLVADPGQGQDPLPVTLAWRTAGAIGAILVRPGMGAVSVPSQGTAVAEARFAGTDPAQPWAVSYVLLAQGPGGSVSTIEPVWVHARPAALALDGPAGSLSIAAEKARDAGQEPPPDP